MGETRRPAERTDGHRARPPGELLEQLRERLDRLADNHPSARAPDSREDGPDTREDGPDTGADTTDAGQDKSGADQNRPADDRDHPRAPGDEAPADPGTVLDIDSRPSGEPYVPWFMSGEPGLPWFAEGSRRR